VRLCREIKSSSTASSAAAGGGHHKSQFLLVSVGSQIPLLLVVPPLCPCPLSNHSSGVSGVRSSTSVQFRIQSRRPGCHSKALRCKGAKDSIGFPAITPSVKSPRDNPSVPCHIMRVPATWRTLRISSPFISNLRSHRISENRRLLDVLPL
jgi:hypothetical protein